MKTSTVCSLDWIGLALSSAVIVFTTASVALPLANANGRNRCKVNSQFHIHTAFHMCDLGPIHIVELCILPYMWFIRCFIGSCFLFVSFLGFFFDCSRPWNVKYDTIGCYCNSVLSFHFWPFLTKPMQKLSFCKMFTRKSCVINGLFNRMKNEFHWICISIDFSIKLNQYFITVVWMDSNFYFYYF